MDRSTWGFHGWDLIGRRGGRTPRHRGRRRRPGRSRRSSTRSRRQLLDSRSSAPTSSTRRTTNPSQTQVWGKKKKKKTIRSRRRLWSERLSFALEVGAEIEGDVWETGEHLFWSRGRRRADAEMWREATAAAAHSDHSFLFVSFLGREKGRWMGSGQLFFFFCKKVTLCGLLN